MIKIMFLENKMAALQHVFLEPCTWCRHPRWIAEWLQSML